MRVRTDPARVAEIASRLLGHVRPSGKMGPVGLGEFSAASRSYATPSPSRIIHVVPPPRGTGPTEAAVVRLRARDDVLDVSLGCAGEPRSGVRAVDDAAHVRNDVLAKGVRSLGPHQATIRAWLVADLSAPRKQCHTARQIWQRLVDERGATVAESTVRALRRPRAPRARVRQHRGDHPPAASSGRGGGGRLRQGERLPGRGADGVVDVSSCGSRTRGERSTCASRERVRRRSSRATRSPSAASAACPGGSATTTSRRRWYACSLRDVPLPVARGRAKPDPCRLVMR